jgi:hypothetical protein
MLVGVEGVMMLRMCFDVRSPNLKVYKAHPKYQIKRKQSRKYVCRDRTGRVFGGHDSRSLLEERNKQSLLACTLIIISLTNHHGSNAQAPPSSTPFPDEPHVSRIYSSHTYQPASLEARKQTHNLASIIPAHLTSPHLRTTFGIPKKQS